MNYLFDTLCPWLVVFGYPLCVLGCRLGSVWYLRIVQVVVGECVFIFSVDIFSIKPPLLARITPLLAVVILAIWLEKKKGMRQATCEKGQFRGHHT